MSYIVNEDVERYAPITPRRTRTSSAGSGGPSDLRDPR